MTDGRRNGSGPGVPMCNTSFVLWGRGFYGEKRRVGGAGHGTKASTDGT